MYLLLRGRVTRDNGGGGNGDGGGEVGDGGGARDGGGTGDGGSNIGRSSVKAGIVIAVDGVRDVGDGVGERDVGGGGVGEKLGVWDEFDRIEEVDAHAGQRDGEKVGGGYVRRGRAERIDIIGRRGEHGHRHRDVGDVHCG